MKECSRTLGNESVDEILKPRGCENYIGSFSYNVDENIERRGKRQV